jgi:hypothetical protein
MTARGVCDYKRVRNNYSLSDQEGGGGGHPLCEKQMN